MKCWIDNISIAFVIFYCHLFDVLRKDMGTKKKYENDNDKSVVSSKPKIENT